MRKKLFAIIICFCAICAYGVLFQGTNATAATQFESKADLFDTTDDTENTSSLPDMEAVTLAQTRITEYLVPTYQYGNYVYYGTVEFDIALNSPAVLDESMDGIYLTCKSSNKNVRVGASLSNNVLHFKVSASKKCTTDLTIGIAGKKFQVKLSLKEVKISATSLLLENGKSKKLKIKGCSKGIKWSSSNKKIATVSKKGVVKAKRPGNVVITAKINGKPIGCAVSVTTGTLKRVCERATYIGTHWTYSQAKRTAPGFYDCSSLVWKAYMECAGLSFGNASYPGTSATESAWCRDNNRMLKGGYTYKKIRKMQLNPGDIVFKSTNLSDPYHTTYHVEMFTGYTCLGYDSKGKPNVTSLWASRGAGYSAEEGSLLARPIP